MIERKDASRHLAAILFTDIVGYTMMMQRDEQQALASVRKHHDILENVIPAYDGEIYQYYGDGSLSIFSSATQAVQCALELQKRMLAEPRVLLRTGIHIGEIYTENGKIFGDGVNVASRIESIGQGGTVLFSRDVYEKIRNHNAFQIKLLGQFEFKNVDDPVSVYALTNPEIITPDGKITEGKLKPQKKKSSRVMMLGLPAVIIALILMFNLFGNKNGLQADAGASDVKKSVAVLPFKNYSGNTEEDFLSTGIAVDILTQLAQIKDLRVISQTSSLKYKDSDKDLMKIAQELGVSNLLDGTVQRYDDNLRVSVHLIDARDESIIWSQSFDGRFSDVLNVQRNVALTVSEKLKISLSPGIKTRLEDRVNVDPEAYVNYQKGQELLARSSGTLAELEQARGYFEKSIEEDSLFALAWVGLADAWIESIFWHRIADTTALPRGRAAAEKAMSLDPGNGLGYGVMGAINLLEKNLELAEKNLNYSIELHPNYSFAYERLAWLALFRDEEEKGFALYDKVIQLDPLSTRLKGSVGSAYYLMGKYTEGIDRMKKFLELDPDDDFILWSLAYCYAGNKEYQKAIETLQKRSIGTNTNWVYAYCYAKLGMMDKAREILDYHIERKKTGHVPDFMMAVQYAALGEKETALDYLEKSVNVTGENWFIIGYTNDPMLASLRPDPRFVNIENQLKNLYKL